MSKKVILAAVITGLTTIQFANAATNAGANPDVVSQHNDRKINPDDKKLTHVSGEVIVKFKRGIGHDKKLSLHKKAKTKIKKTIKRLNIDLVKSLNNETTEVLLKRYKNNPNVEYVEPNGIVQIQLTPNDPRFSEQWGLESVTNIDVDAPEAWDIQTGASSVVVATIDTGVDYTHEDLAANMWVNPGEIPANGIDDDNNGYIDDIRGWDFLNNDNDPADDHGHGTHVSGIIAASTNNATGIAGVSWQSRIMPLKTHSQHGFGSIFDAAEALVYAVDMGASVTNNSYGCLSESCFSSTFEDALDYAEQNNVLSIIAAGNYRSDNDITAFYPCNSENNALLCVAASEPSDNLAWFSNYGSNHVGLAAPGFDILSTVPGTGNSCCSDPSGYMLLSGTSMATPFVAGAAAVILSQHPGSQYESIKSIIMGSTIDSVNYADKVRSQGRLNLFNAITTNFFIIAEPIAELLTVGQQVNTPITLSYLNGYSADVSLSAASNDPNLLVSITPDVVSLAGQTATLTISAQDGVVAGLHTIYITATSNDGSTQTHKATVDVIVTTDLVSNLVFGDDFGVTGREIDISAQIYNASQTVTENFYVHFYLSQDAVITSEDIRIGTHHVSSISPFSNLDIQKSVWVPRWNSPSYGYPALAEGGYHFGMIVDSYNVLADTDQLNNVVTGNSIDVRTGVDDAVELAVGHNVEISPFYSLHGEHVAIDDLGNMYRSASKTNGSDYDFYTVKLDSSGNFVWDAIYDNGYDDHFSSSALDSDGNLYVVGYSHNGVDDDRLLIKYDNNGNKLWDRQHDAGGDEYNYHLFIGSNGTVYVGGDPGGIMAYTPAGDLLWPSLNAINEMVEDVDGNIIGIGYYVLEKNMPDGTNVWTINLSEEIGYFVVTDALGNIYTATTNVGGTRDAFLTKYDTNGNEIWKEKYDNGRSDMPRGGLVVDSQGNPYVLLRTNNDLNKDYAIVKYDPDSNLVWEKIVDNGGHDEPAALKIDLQDKLYITGTSCNNALGNDSCWQYQPTPGGGRDHLTIKMDTDGNTIWTARHDQVLLDTVQGRMQINSLGEMFISGFDASTREAYTIKYLTPDEIMPQAPVANAGVDFVVNQGHVGLLDGAMSYDLDGSIVSYTWLQTSGPAVSLTSQTSATTSFTAPLVAVESVLVFELTVTDNEGATASDTVNVTVTIPLVANAGPDQSVDEDTLATLNGSGTSGDGMIVAYNWVQISGPAVTLFSPTFATTSFMAPLVDVNTVLVFELTVTDNEGITASDTVNVTVSNANIPPIANAGPDQSVDEGTIITLNGSGTDSNGTVVAYSWVQISGPAATLTSPTSATTSFTAPLVASTKALVFELTVTDNEGATASDTVYVTVSNVIIPPVANAGVDQSVDEDTIATLSGSGTDSNGTVVAYSWVQTSGPAVSLTSPTSATTSFTAPLVDMNTVLVFELTVTDNDGATATDTINITVTNLIIPPVSNAGVDQSADEDTIITLNGSGTDSNGTIVAYSWVQTSGPATTLTSPTSATTSFTAPLVDVNTVLVFELTVTDNDGATATDTINVSVTNVIIPPVANAGVDQLVDEDTIATLNGSGTDSNGTVVAYSWVQISGPAATLTSPTSATTSFTAPLMDVNTVLVFELMVTDNDGATATDTINIVVTNVLIPPVANAGVDLSVDEDTIATLNGSGTDSNGTLVAYSWTQTSGPAVSLTSPTAATTSFTAPLVDADMVLVFELTVTDNDGATATDTINITVTNVIIPPVANAGVDQTVNKRTEVTLDGSASYDPNGNIVSYQWIQVSGTVVTLINANSAVATFTTPNKPQSADLVFKLTVIDNDGSVGVDQVAITVTK